MNYFCPVNAYFPKSCPANTASPKSSDDVYDCKVRPTRFGQLHRFGRTGSDATLRTHRF